MGPANCAVIGCQNSTAKLKKWENTVCKKIGHDTFIKKNCGCQKPFILYMFPSEKSFREKREAWTKLLKRETAKKTACNPCPSDRVCSLHFVDGVPSVENPNPTLNLGYSRKDE